MIPAGFVGLVLPISQIIDESKYILLITGFAYISFSVIMYYAEKISEGETIIENISINEAFTIGVAQSFALLPGVSRSGMTLITAMFLKIKKKDAIFFSLLLGIPTIFGAWLITLLQSTEGINSNLIIPTLFAFIAGTIAIKILINFTVNSKLKIFSYYCFAIGIISCSSFLINL
jgi:undecaprenyl-diphosphatase